VTTLNSILNIAQSGLFTAQTGLGVTSDNVANVNTSGYVRKVIDQTSLATNGVGSGVSAAGVTRAANQFLQNASLTAAASAGSASVVSDLLNQAQGLFGDPSSTSSYLDQVNQVFSDLAAVANDPSSAVSSAQAVNDVSQFLGQSQTIATSLSQLTTQADSRVGTDVTQVNQLLTQISSLNDQIASATAQGADATTPQNTQSELINQLSSLMGIQAQATSTGGVIIRASGGATLVGQVGAATLSYQSSATGASQLSIAQPGATAQPVPLSVNSGEISGLMSLRNTQLPALSAQLSQYVSGTVSALNKASNAASSVPAPTTLTGRDTGYGQDEATALGGFTGKSTIAIVSSSGALQQQISVDFGAGTFTDSQGNVTNFTPGTFAASLTTALGTYGSASFSNGALSISATNGSGVAIADDATTPSSKAGEGFSQYLGLNDLVTSTGIANFHTGLQTTSTNGFTAGGVISLKLNSSTGDQLAGANVTIPAGGTIQTVLNTLNSPTAGLGLYGQFSLDSTGALSFSPTTAGASLSVVSDNTQWGTGGASMSQLFGIGTAQQASRTGTYQVRADIAADPTKLQTATLNLASGTTWAALAPGDGSGALALSKAGQATTSFDAAGGLAAINTTVTQYAALLGGTLGNQAAAATQANTSATAVQTEADARRQSVEGVSLDQELVNLTTYQQAYSASARLVTANQDMFTALLNMVP
jgi:flagellar hook-associated protein 1 FlgK